MDNRYCERKAVAGFSEFLTPEIHGDDWSVSFLDHFNSHENFYSQRPSSLCCEGNTLLSAGS
jgi:hypothetical protein